MLEHLWAALEARAAVLLVEISEIVGRYSKTVKRQSRHISPRETATVTVNSTRPCPRLRSLTPSQKFGYVDDIFMHQSALRHHLFSEGCKKSHAWQEAGEGVPEAASARPGNAIAELLCPQRPLWYIGGDK